MRVEIDADKCIGSGACVIACPDVFSQDDSCVVILLDPAPAAPLHDQVREAVRACPAQVIAITDEAGVP
ncbi:MAG: ferredoxin [Acidimicrobiales bacterium]|jgi:ferredoxin